REDFRPRSDSQSAVRVSFHIDDTNFGRSGASYVRFAHGTDPENLIEQSTSNIWRRYLSNSGAVIPFSGFVNQGETYYYQIQAYDDQYNVQIVDGSFRAPIIRRSGNFSVERNRDTRLRSYENFVVNGRNTLPDPVILSTMSGSEVIEGENARIFAGTGTTIESLESGESITWGGIFKVPEEVDLDSFLDVTSTFSGSQLSTFSIPKMVKIGGDQLGLRMNLNQPVDIELDIPDTTKEYIVIQSEDGVNWTRNTSALTKTSNSVRFSTDHFSFFAVVEVDDDGNPVDTTVTPSSEPQTPTVSSGGGGGGGGGSTRRNRIAKKDFCPRGDYTGNYYDGRCGQDPEALIANAMYDVDDFGQKFSSMRDDDVMMDGDLVQELRKPVSRSVRLYSKSSLRKAMDDGDNSLPESEEQTSPLAPLLVGEGDSEEVASVGIKKYRSKPLQKLYEQLETQNISDEQKEVYEEALDRVYAAIESLDDESLSEQEIYDQKASIQKAFLNLQSRIDPSSASEITDISERELTREEKKELVRQKIREINRKRKESQSSTVIPELTPKNIRKDSEDEDVLSLEERKAQVREKIREINKKKAQERVKEKIREYNAQVSQR
ncbi:hypothetical protein MK079_02095, partial [Candidatus Gracilibacteria bacterium]|nr:hypothetical protein [Candidatus Gracilibacteria bacterium]